MDPQRSPQLIDSHGSAKGVLCFLGIESMLPKLCSDATRAPTFSKARNNPKADRLPWVRKKPQLIDAHGSAKKNRAEKLYGITRKSFGLVGIERICIKRVSHM